MAYDDKKTSVGYQQLTVSNTAVALTVPPRASTCLLIVSTNAIRFRGDGTNPTAGVGMPMVAGQSLEYNADPRTLKLIRQSADAVVDVEFYE